MNAPLLWVVLPVATAILLLFLPSQRWTSLLGSAICAALALLALFVPIDIAQRLPGDISIRIESTLVVFGRTLELSSADQIVLVIIYSLVSFWFFGTLASANAGRIVPFGLMMTALLVASLAVTPFLYAALFIEMAVLLTIPMLALPGRRAGRGLLRFVIYQTLAMPFILFAGFLLSGVEAGPRDLGLVVQASVFLALGFAFLFSIFPLYAWVPMLTEESHPYAVAFILSVFPTFHLVFGMNFLDRYAWLRDAEELTLALRLVGLMMVASAGAFAAFQRHLGRILGYTAVAQTGLALLALSLPDRAIGIQTIFAMIIPRAIGLAVWAMSLTTLWNKAPTLRFTDLQGWARQYPVATTGIILTHLSLAGIPLLAGFPVIQALWEQLAIQTLSGAFWLGFGIFGLWVAALRSLTNLVSAPDNTVWASQEKNMERILIGLGLLLLFTLGLFPQWATPLLSTLPNLFENLAK